MEQSYAVEYRNLYENHWWWRSRESEILRNLDQFLNSDRALKILDVGCGDGLFFEKLQRYGDVTGVESDVNTFSKESPWLSKIHNVPFNEKFQPGETFDVILMLDILEHMPDPLSALRHARTLLSPEGILLATVPAFNALWTSHDVINHHVLRYRRETFHPLFEQSGLPIKKSKYLFHWTCPVKMAIRGKEWLLGAQPKPPSVPPTWLNKACLALTRMENWLFSKVAMPFGSSLMVVGQRDG